MVQISNRPAGTSAGLSGSLGRGLHLLAVLANAQQPLGLSDLAARASFDKATTHRLARTLLKFGYLSQDSESRRYRLGVRVLDLGYAYLSRLDVREQALPFMHVLVKEFSESVSLSILDGADVVYIERVRAGTLSVGIEVHVGTRIPVHCSSMGKALLAWLPLEQARQVLAARPLVPLTPNTITDRVRLEQEFDQVRARGFAINDEEMAFGLRSAAAVIRDRRGWPVAALNAAVATARFTRQELETQVAPRVAECARAISAQLGFNQGVAATSSGRGEHNA
ncbi:MAG: IclR family transcriptional regulator [Chloroflexi bacterium]|nr:IclR family transcriptional regulator [Chloroflexota bacterium]